MDDNQYQNWLNELNKDTALIVPTRSLASSLIAQVSDHYIAQEKLVWEAPNVLMWGDYLGLMWQLNADKLSTAHTLINRQQSLLLWVQVIEVSRRQERDLTLLNVQQTARAVQRSWRLMHEWGVSQTAIAQDHVEDIEQFLTWLSAYQDLLEKRGLIDESLLVQALIETDRLEYPFKRLIWHSYDLVTDAQQRLNEQATESGVDISIASSARARSPEIDYVKHANSNDEIRSTFIAARTLIESSDPGYTINVVIPDLQRQQAQIRELAREIFYPSESPLATQQMDTVYRFSLGQPLNEWPAIETGLSLIKLLKNRTSLVDLGFVLRSQFLGLSRDHEEECRLFERWLKRQRVSNLLVDNLPALYEQCLEFINEKKGEKNGEQTEPSKSSGLLMALNDIVVLRKEFEQRLAEQKEQNKFATISFPEWVNVFDQWLVAWGWHTEVKTGELDSEQYQLLTRWQRLLEEYAGLSAVQSSVGLNRAIEVLQQMARDAVFLPQAAASPILISGIYEAIGRPVDHCFLTGMNDKYPPSQQNDAFVPNRILQETGFPNATAQRSYSQAEKVINSLLASSDSAVLSYAQFDQQDSEIQADVSPLFRDAQFKNIEVTDLGISINEEQSNFDLENFSLENYDDTQGPAWSSAKGPRGGSAIFENQSNCAFKAFATHQLRYERDQEAEFGLDGLDRGNVVHRMLELVWQTLQTQANLKAMSESDLETLIDSVVEQAIVDQSEQLNDDKAMLLKHEQPRLSNLLKYWLALEVKRPLGFSVVEREESRQGNIGGIDFRYIIDRVDKTDDGRRLIIDYKTGTVARRDWTEERIAKPQMPLYSVMLNRAESEEIVGISYAKVDAKKHEFVELSEAGILKTNTSHTQKYEAQWQEGKARWPELFEELAKQFLAGDAQVNPIEESTCLYCDLQSFCRISQLRETQKLKESGDLAELQGGMTEGNHDQ